MSNLNNKIDELKTEIQEETRVLEKEIEQILGDFSNRTGLKIQDITIKYQDYIKNNTNAKETEVKYSIKFKIPPIQL